MLAWWMIDIASHRTRSWTARRVSRSTAGDEVVPATGTFPTNLELICAARGEVLR